jgi:hypothetical protein
MGERMDFGKCASCGNQAVTLPVEMFNGSWIPLCKNCRDTDEVINYNQKKIDRQLEYIDGRIAEFTDALDAADSQEERSVLAEKIQTQKSRKLRDKNY